MIKLNRCFFILLFLLPSWSFSQSKFCINWFSATKINSSDKKCVSKCIHYDKIMDEAVCGFDCRKFCKPQKCKVDSYWNKKIKSGRPKNWEAVEEKTSIWSESEKDQVAQILNQLPDELKSIPLKGIYRMKESDIINPGTTSADGQYIVLYDRAFGHTVWTTEEVLFHELGHVLYQSMGNSKRKKYRKNAGWDERSKIKNPDLRNFISSRSRDNDAEDFAENFKFYLLDSEDLKNKVKKIYDWFLKEYKNIKLKGCEK